MKPFGYVYPRYVRGSFQAAFSRAVRSLVRRGLIERVCLAPAAAIDRYSSLEGRLDRYHVLSDSTYFMAPERQTRFVRTVDNDAR